MAKNYCNLIASNITHTNHVVTWQNLKNMIDETGNKRGNYMGVCGVFYDSRRVCLILISI